MTEYADLKSVMTGFAASEEGITPDSEILVLSGCPARSGAFRAPSTSVPFTSLVCSEVTSALFVSPFVFVVFLLHPVALIRRAAVRSAVNMILFAFFIYILLDFTIHFTFSIFRFIRMRLRISPSCK